MDRPVTTSQRALVLAGSIGPLGYLPASGTSTVAIIGIPLFWLTRDVPSGAYVVGVVLFTAASMWLHDVGDRILAQQDSRKLVWDELDGFLVAVAFVPFTWQLAVAAFVIERGLDIVKVPPANWIDRHWHGGVGVVGDDLIAGAYTCGLLHLLVYVAPGWVGLTV